MFSISGSSFRKNIARILLSVFVCNIFSPLQFAFAAVTWNIIYSTTAPTNQNVIATLNTSESVTFDFDTTSPYSFSENGSTTLYFHDADNNDYSVDIEVNNIDKVIPVVTLIGSGTMNLTQGQSFVDPGATWSDAKIDKWGASISNGNGTIAVATTGVVDTNTPGTYILTYNKTDDAGNPGVAVTRTVTVTEAPDTLAPVITLSGSSNMTVLKDTSFTDPGATCTDDRDTTCTVTVSGSVNIAIVGTYTLVYSAVDLAHNAATSLTRSVTVTMAPDTTPPVITLSGASTMSIYVGSGFTDPGATCTDDRDTTCTVTVSGSINASQTGTYILTYSAKDTANNSATGVTRTIYVISPVNPSPNITILSASVSGTGQVSVLSGTIISSGGVIDLNNFPINVVSTGGNLSITGGVDLVVLSGSWDGILIAPVTITGGLVLDASDIGFTTSLPSDTTSIDYTHTPIATFFAGSTGASLVASGGYISLSYHVDDISIASGALLTVLSSVDGITWGINTPTATCIVDSNKNCTFLTNTLGYFGMVSTTSTPIGGPTPSNVLILTQSYSATGSSDLSTGSIASGTTIDLDNFPLVLTSTSGSLSISGSTDIVTSGDWSGTIVAPIVVTGSSALRSLDSGVLASLPADTQSIDYTYTPVLTFQAGASGASLIASGGLFTLTYKLSNVASGTVLTIFRSNDGASWNLNTNISTCTVDSDGYCAFTTDHLSYFGFVQSSSSPLDTTPPTASVIYSTTGATNQDVIATLTGASESITITSTGGTTHTFTTNGTFTFEFKDASNNTGSAIATVNNIDKQAPVITLNGSGSITVAQVSTGSYTDSGAIWTDNVDGSGSVTASGTVDLTTLGTYTLTYDKVDSVGNSATQVTRTVIVADLTPPTASVIYSTTGATNQDVIATLTGASESITITSTGGTTHTFTTNGTFTFEFKDASNNTGSAIATVNNIDKQAPVITLNGSGSITVAQVSTGSYTDSGAIWTDNVDGSGSVTASGTVDLTTLGTYTLTYDKVDSVGNSATQVTRTVIVADLTPPTASVIYSTTGATNQDVIATLTGASESITITSTGGTTHTFTTNGTFTFEFKDASNNTGSAIATVNNIDKQAPVITLNGSGSITVAQVSTGSYTDSGAIWTDNVDGSGSVTASGTVDLTTLGTYTLTYDKVDSVGNSATQVTRTVIVADLTPPTASVIYSTTGATNQDVIATLTGASESITITSTGGTTHTFTTNGTFTFEFKDASNNTGSAIATVNNIDKQAPVITLNGSGSITVAQVSTGSYTDSGAIWTDNVDGSGSVTASGTVDLTTLGTYTLTYDKVDSVGNSATQVTRTVIVADLTPPTASVIYSTTGATNQDVIATLTGASESITITSTGGTTHTFTTNGTFTFEFKDASNNTGSAIATVNNIDKQAPVITLNGSGSITVAQVSTGSYTDSGAIWTDNVDGSGSVTASGTVDLTTLGTYTLTYDKVDSVGNSATQVTRTVIVADLTPPTASVIYSTTGATNQDVIATLTGASESITITSTGGTTHTFTTNGTFTFEFKDASNNTGSAIATVNNIDKQAPVITLNGSGSITVAQVSTGSYTDSGAIWTDNVDGSGSVTASGTVDLTTLGTYTLTYDKVDSVGNSATQVTRTVIVADLTPPTASVIYSTTGATNQDVIATLTGASESITITSTGGTTHTFTTNGTFTFEFKDASNNTGSAIATVNNIDKQAPVITLNGSGSITVAQVSTGSYTDSGAIWTDNVDGSGSVTASGTVDLTTLGTYTLTYDKVDSVGNSATQVTRTVIVADLTPPMLVLNGLPNITIEASTGNYVDSGAIWTDNIDGSGAALSYSGLVNTSIPGIYTLEYKKTDIAGNTSNIISRTITVVDTTAPVTILNGSSSLTLEAGSSFLDPGALWTDIVDGSGSILKSTSGSVNYAVPGVYQLEYAYTDTYGNTGNAIRTITIRDTISPTLYLVGNATETFEASTGVYTDLGASYSDTVIGIGVVALATSGSVSMSIPGTYTLTYTKADNSGNTGSISRTVNIIDTTRPVIVMNGNSQLTISGGTTYVDAGARWFDIVDGSGSLTASGLVNTSLSGTYTLTYSYTDTSGNKTIVSRTVIVTQNTNTGTTNTGTTNTGSTTPSNPPVQPSIGGGGTSGGGGSSVPFVVFSPNLGNSAIGITNSLTPFATKKVLFPNFTSICKKEVKNLDDNRLFALAKTLGVSLTGSNKNITRGEFLKLTLDTAGINLSGVIYNSTYKDVSSSNKYASYVTYATRAGIISGYKDGTFKPDSIITRGEVAKILVMTANISLAKTSTTFDDVGQSDMALSIQAAYDNCILQGRRVGKFEPNSAMTLAEAIKVLYNISLK